jgi:hypothetical protein
LRLGYPGQKQKKHAQSKSTLHLKPPFNPLSPREHRKRTTPVVSAIYSASEIWAIAVSQGCRDHTLIGPPFNC